MMMRLVLVGAVAAMGITVPTWPQIRGGMQALHSWTVGRLAAWDARRSFEYDLDMPPPPAARPRPAVIAEATSLSVERIAVALDWMPRGDTPPADVALAVPPFRGDTERPAPAPRSRPRPERATARVVAAMEWDDFRALLRDGEAPDASDGGDQRRVGATGRDAPDECLLTASTTAQSPAPAQSIATKRDGMRPLPGVDGESGIRTPEIAEAWERSANEVGGVLRNAQSALLGWMKSSGSISTGPALAESTTAAPAPTEAELLDPEAGLTFSATVEIEPVSGRDAGPAAALREGASPPSRSATGQAAAPSPAVARAMRLTRSALRAWARLMARPSAIKVSVR